MCIEIMGNKAGWLTLYSGIAGGADIILLLELPYDIKKVAAAVENRGSVDAVNDLGGDVHSSVEAERHVGAVDVVVDGLGQTDDVQALLA